ncbi:MAG: YihY/virulence factor BrkB family protein [Defluviitaleaceae bacterium]|nr:YihY/virulence factor BrkB family protein [Defluviitaleaceae bacterium]
MKNFTKFIKSFAKEAKDTEILPLATQLTYRLIFSLFPFLIFLVSLVGYFNIDSTYLLAEVSALFPTEIANTINTIIHEVVDLQNPAVMSIGLILSLYTVINGFRAIMRGVNRVYNQNDDRHWFKKYAICALCVIILAFAIIASLFTIIFRDITKDFVASFFEQNAAFDGIFGVVGFVVTAALLLVAIILIYHLCSAVKHRFKSLIPGAILTIVVWAVSTFAFNIYVSNFANFSIIYGSIASIFIMMLWLNIISTTILFGALLNARLDCR